MLSVKLGLAPLLSLIRGEDTIFMGKRNGECARRSGAQNTDILTFRGGVYKHNLSIGCREVREVKEVREKLRDISLSLLGANTQQ